MYLNPGDVILVGDHTDFTRATEILRELGIDTEPHETDPHLVVVTQVREDPEGGDHARD